MTPAFLQSKRMPGEFTNRIKNGWSFCTRRLFEGATSGKNNAANDTDHNGELIGPALFGDNPLNRDACRTNRMRLAR
jgi:hypothetical protein